MKVFSREKYLRVMDEIDPRSAKERRGYEWTFECEGKSKEECNALGYVVNPDWMEEGQMTEREACERIVIDGGCSGVLCSECPLLDGDWNCNDMDEVRLAGLWLTFHPIEEKEEDKARTIKVFRKRKMMETLKDPAIVMMADHAEWAIACDGMSVDFLRYIGLIIKDEWCEEVEL